MIAVKQQTFLEFTFTLASCGAPKSGKTDTFDFDREKIPFTSLKYCATED